MRALAESLSRSPGRVLALLLLVLLGCVVLFMTLGVQGSWSFALQFRAGKLATMLLVAFAIGISTVLFQTATGNRVLTPAIMGFDSLYVLIQTLLIFHLGSGLVVALDRRLTFGVEVAAMIGFAALLYWLLFAQGRRSLHLLVLSGVVLGVLFRSLSGFLQRVIDPNEFMFLQDRLFASFNRPDLPLLGVALLAALAVAGFGWRRLAGWDVLVLGRDAAIGLGLDHRREVMLILVLVAVLVAVSTALVGPVTFFGLLVAHLAYALVPSHRHRHLLPAAWLIGAICLVGGQTLLERGLGYDGNLRVIIDFIGGVVFIALLMRRSLR